MEAIPDKRDKNAPRTPAEIGRDYCDQLFHLEEQMKHLTPEDRYTKRLELEKPVLEAFWCWLDSVNALKERIRFRKSSYLCSESKAIYGELSS